MLKSKAAGNWYNWSCNGKRLMEGVARWSDMIKYEMPNIIVEYINIIIVQKYIRILDKAEYLKKEGIAGSQRLIARWESVKKRNRCWLEEEKRKCILCSLEVSVLKHSLNDCYRLHFKRERYGRRWDKWSGGKLVKSFREKSIRI